MRIATVCLVLGLLSSTAFSQELTTAQVLARMDEKAKAFTSLEASISQAQVVADFKHPVESGKIFMKMIKSNPAVYMDITDPKKMAKTVLIKDGNLKAYFGRPMATVRVGRIPRVVCCNSCLPASACRPRHKEVLHAAGYGHRKPWMASRRSCWT